MIPPRPATMSNRLRNSRASPFGGLHDWVEPRRNMLLGLGAGIAGGRNWSEGLGQGFANAAAGRAQDDAYATQQKAEAERQQQLNRTIEWMQEKAVDDPRFGDLISGLENGAIDMSTAYKAAMDWSAPDPYTLGPGETRFGPDNKPVASGTPKPLDTPDPPSGYAWGEGGNLEFIPGGPADPATRGADMTQAEQRNQQLATVIAQELPVVEENWDELTNPMNQMIGASAPGIGAPALAGTSAGYQQATNALKTIIASYLYSVSGATATDAEVSRQVDMLTPKFGESKESADLKKARVRTMAQAVATAGRVDLSGSGLMTKYGLE